MNGRPQPPPPGPPPAPPPPPSPTRSRTPWPWLAGAGAVAAGLVDEWQDGSAFLLDLSAGDTATMSCTVPGVAEPGVTEYWIEVTTWSGYNISTQSAHWFVEVAP